MVEHAPVEIGAYLHFVKGSVAVTDTQAVAVGDFLANAGDMGNAPCGAYHLHYALHTHPESQAAVLVTFPSAFNNYEVSTDLGGSWQKVVRGIPKDGEWVRPLANLTKTMPRRAAATPHLMPLTSAPGRYDCALSVAAPATGAFI